MEAAMHAPHRAPPQGGHPRRSVSCRIPRHGGCPRRRAKGPCTPTEEVTAVTRCTSSRRSKPPLHTAHTPLTSVPPNPSFCDLDPTTLATDLPPNTGEDDAHTTKLPAAGEEHLRKGTPHRRHPIGSPGLFRWHPPTTVRQREEWEGGGDG
jgi:hypothetical protein